MRIELTRVEKRFGRIRALREVSLTVPQGRRVALIGPNGSGKSTLIRVVLGLQRCEGTVLLDGLPPLRARAHLARKVAYVPQLPPQMAAPVSELLQAVTAVRQLQPGRVAALAERLELDLTQVAPRPFRELSGGTKQKVLLALALAAGGSLFILDEPTASLDARTRAAFLRLFDELAGGTTLLLCSHRLEEIRHLVDHVVMLEEGRVAYDGAASTFLEARGLSVVELRLGAGEIPGWLAEHGFSAGAGGWWSRTAAAAEKVELVREAALRLGPRLENLVVRDLEAVGGGHHGAPRG